MHEAAHIMMILDIATSARLIDFCHQAIKPCDLKHLLRNLIDIYKISRNFMADIRILLRNTRGGQSRKW